MKKLGIIYLVLISFMISACSQEPDPTINSTLDEKFANLQNSYSDSANFHNSKAKLIGNEPNPNANRFKAQLKYVEGEYFLHNSEFSAAKQKLDSALIFANQDNEFDIIGEIYYSKAGCERGLNNNSQAIIFYKNSVTNFSKTENKIKLGLALNGVGYLYWEFARFDSALVYFEKSAEVKSKLPDLDSYATTLNNIGTVHYHWAGYDKALDYFTRSLEIKKLFAEHDGTALIMANVGLIYKETGQYNKALETFNECLLYAAKEPYNTTYGYIYHNFASVYLAQVKIDSAKYYFNKSFHEYDLAENDPGKIIATMGLGECFLQQGDIETAESHFRTMLDLAGKTNNSLRIAEAYKLLGTIEAEKNNTSGAQLYFTKSIEIGKSINKVELLMDNYFLLSTLLEKEEKIGSAFNAFKEYEKYKEIIRNKNVDREMAKLQYSIESEKLLNTIETQKYENEKQSIFLYGLTSFSIILMGLIYALFRATSRMRLQNKSLANNYILIENQKEKLEKLNYELKEANITKDKFFSIIAHDLKSPFQILLSNSEFILEDLKEIQNEEILLLAEGIHETARNTYKLLDNLLQWAFVQKGKVVMKIEQISSGELVADSISSVKGSADKKNISLNTIAETDCNFKTDKNMLEFVLRNLISNSIKFTPVNGHVDIIIKSDSDFVVFKIRDNGIGMNEQKISELFDLSKTSSQPGTQNEAGTGLGLIIVKEFMDKLNGNIEIQSKEGHGTTFTLQIPNQSTIILDNTLNSIPA
ncbi:MAG: tetratricopeptide repeat-containing sensor histidine kinase [Melioribacteraceae bacterium]|nr:tetratricopeptide repeat-containing sensor histidine kinase [Melioribacteraceae bacterium]MCF8265368.1 tetratricopeptide repeat-containing sensor histidine kinase [Melioribacteraceae bacterium]